MGRICGLIRVVMFATVFVSRIMFLGERHGTDDSNSYLDESEGDLESFPVMTILLYSRYLIRIARTAESH